MWVCRLGPARAPQSMACARHVLNGLPADEPQRPPAQGGASWRGMSDPIRCIDTRLARQRRCQPAYPRQGCVEHAAVVGAQHDGVARRSERAKVVVPQAGHALGDDVACQALRPGGGGGGEAGALGRRGVQRPRRLGTALLQCPMRPAQRFEGHEMLGCRPASGRCAHALQRSSSRQRGASPARLGSCSPGGAAQIAQSEVGVSRAAEFALKKLRGAGCGRKTATAARAGAPLMCSGPSVGTQPLVARAR